MSAAVIEIPLLQVVDCPSGKLGYPRRRWAAADAKRLRRLGRGHMRPYRCGRCRRWHLGHLPGAVLAGRATADELYARRSR